MNFGQAPADDRIIFSFMFVDKEKLKQSGYFNLSIIVGGKRGAKVLLPILPLPPKHSGWPQVENVWGF